MSKRSGYILFGLCALVPAVFAGAALADTPPKVDPAYPAPVIYPMPAQASGEEGAVDLAIFITSRGQPTSQYKVIGSSGHSDLDAAALQSAMNWHYLPARDASGDAEAGWVRVHIDYKLPPDRKQKQH